MINYEELVKQYADLMKEIYKDSPEQVVDLSNGILGEDNFKTGFIAGEISINQQHIHYVKNNHSRI